MTIADVVDFYERSAVLQAKGGEEPCTGCDKVLEKDEAFSYYEIAGRPRTPHACPRTGCWHRAADGSSGRLPGSWRVMRARHCPVVAGRAGPPEGGQGPGGSA